MTVRNVGTVGFAPDIEGEDAVRNEERYRAAVDNAFVNLSINDANLDNRVTRIEVIGLALGGSPNLDGGRPDSNYGGINAIFGGTP